MENKKVLCRASNPVTIRTPAKMSARRSRIASFRPEQQNRDADAVLNPAGGGAEKNIGQKSVAMRAHRHQIAALLPDPS